MPTRQTNYSILGLGAYLLLNPLLSFGGQTTSLQRPSTSSVVEALKAASAPLQSGYFTYRVVTTYLAPPFARGAHVPSTDYMAFAFKGVKRFYQTNSNPNDASSAQFIVDGKNYYTQDVATGSFNGRRMPSSVVHDMQPAFQVDENPLLYGYMDALGRWYAQVAAQAKQLTVRGSKNDPHWGSLYEVVITDAQGNRLDGWVAPRFGNMIVRADFFFLSNREDRFECLSAKQIDGVWIPTEGRSSTYASLGSGSKLTLCAVKELYVTSCHLNNVSDDIFKPDLKPGSLYRDYFTHHDYLVGANGQLILDPRSDWNKSQPYFWRRAFILSLTALFFFLVSFIVYRQRRPRLKKG
ncbi:MAG TPA: hypothetical protein VKV18_00645 [Chthonomonas sp.]|uniref:hypothetical protein n=1 Tax=Chthonomonas sp. TaxID=2282153 RepID=UPI002B4B5219|nr:hypothetical protein [Chthonomonas sp.]HLI47186.1 hypothetical protein [Chthonomonas sp.]